jgi:hypothetical protein
MRDDGDGPRNSIEAIILKASTNISKIWYEQGYVEGSTAAPDCFSNNGISPEPTSAKKQCDSCALCPMNQWGSRITPAGKAGKACSDSKRLAVVPMNDIDNDAFGGPMLLRVPAASLQDLAMYGQKMQQMGYPYFAIATKIAFDPAESYPKFVFSALRPLSDEEADKVMALRDGHQVQRILSENEFAAAAAAVPETSGQPIFEQSDAGPRNVQETTQASVGDQARAAAAAQAAQAQAQAQAAAQAKAQAETQAKAAAAAQQAQAQQTTQASGFGNTAAVTSQGNVEDEVARKMREMEEELARMKALAAQQAQVQETKVTETAGNAAATTAATQQPTEAAPVQEQVTNATASPSDDGLNVASQFEQDLDSMLSELLPNAS